MSSKEVVSVRLLKPWNLFNANEVIGVPADAVERMEKIKLAKRVLIEEVKAEAKPPLKQKRVRALKAFDQFNKGEECVVVANDGLENLVEKGVVEVLGDYVEPAPETKKIEAPAMNKAIAQPAKAK